jgi:hypothetical protein
MLWRISAGTFPGIEPWTCWQTAIYCWTPFPDDQRFGNQSFCDV